MAKRLVSEEICEAKHSCLEDEGIQSHEESCSSGSPDEPDAGIGREPSSGGVDRGKGEDSGEEPGFGGGQR